MLSCISVCTVQSSLTCASTTTAWPVTWHLPFMPSCVIKPLPMVTHWTWPSRRAWTTLGTPSSRLLAWWQETRSLMRSDILVLFQTRIQAPHIQAKRRGWPHLHVYCTESWLFVASPGHQSQFEVTRATLIKSKLREKGRKLQKIVESCIYLRKLQSHSSSNTTFFNSQDFNTDKNLLIIRLEQEMIVFFFACSNFRGFSNQSSLSCFRGRSITA